MKPDYLPAPTYCAPPNAVELSLIAYEEAKQRRNQLVKELKAQEVVTARCRANLIAMGNT